MNQQPTKRRNPFEKMISSVEKEIETPVVEETNEEIAQPIEERIVEEPIYVEEEPVQTQHRQEYQPQPQYYQPVQAQKQPVRQNYSAPKVVNRQTKNYYAPQQNEIRDKFTSTMEQSLRRSIKVVCAQRGIMFAQFVEEACREKLNREGFR